MRLRKAKVSDLERVYRMICAAAKKGDLEYREVAEIGSTLESFAIVEDNGRIVGCGQLEIYNRRIAEIRSLCVKGKDKYKLLIDYFKDEVTGRGVEKLFLIASKWEIALLEPLGFKPATAKERVGYFWDGSNRLAVKKSRAVRRAEKKDVTRICDLINEASKRNELLPRTRKEIEEHLLEFYIVAPFGERIEGCCALELYNNSLAEVRSLTVSSAIGRQGWGKTLVRYCLKDAKVAGIKEVMAITHQEKFFRALGFRPATRRNKMALFWQPIH